MAGESRGLSKLFGPRMQAEPKNAIAGYKEQVSVGKIACGGAKRSPPVR
jgi:hypothetical protein